MSFLTKKIFNSSDDICGLDLSDLSVKVVALKNNGKHTFVSGFGFANIPSGSIVDGEIIKKDLVAGAIEKAFEISGPRKIKAKKVICSLPETKAFLRIINIPNMAEEEMREAVKWEMEANIPLSFDQVYYDWQLLENKNTSKKNGQDVLVVAVARNVVDSVIDVIERVKKIPIAFEIESIAQTRSLIGKGCEEKKVLIADIGDRRTSFAIIDGGIPCFTSSIPLCGQSMSYAIAKSLGISFEEAEKKKLQYETKNNFKEDVIFLSLEPILENIASEIERSIDFYLSGLQYSSQIDCIIICGGGANMKGIIPFFIKRLQQEVKLGDPWVTMDLGKNIPIINRENSVQYSTAIGLALKAKEYENLS